MEKEKNYKVKVFCTNCGFEGETAIPLKREIKEHPCPVCDCKKLFRKNEY